MRIEDEPETNLLVRNVPYGVGGLGFLVWRARLPANTPSGPPLENVGRGQASGLINGRAPAVDPVTGLPPQISSGQELLRRPKKSAYRCFLPDLTGFAALRRAGPGHQH